jgi:nickel/cobalt exporter
MPSIESVIQSGVGNPWLLLPLALLLGALHALEPGHSKSMMTAFIVAVNGTTRQAVLLGLAATVGHTIVVWVLALIAWRIGDSGVLEKAEPWLLLIGGALLVLLSWSIIARLAPAMRQYASGSGGHGHAHGHSHGTHDHSHSHGHGDGGHGHSHGAHSHGHAHDHGLRPAAHTHGADRPHAHSHDGAHAHHHAHPPMDDDAHAAYHAAEVQNRFAGRSGVTDREVAWFGFTGGLLPCPAAFAVLLACLHQKAYGLGVVMVAAFSIGLAAMLVAIGVAAAWGTGALTSRVSGFSRFASWAPYVSAAIVLVIGLVTMAQGLASLI